MKMNRILHLALAILLIALPVCTPFVADPTAKNVSVRIFATRNSVVPNDITVYVGQIVTFDITSADPFRTDVLVLKFQMLGTTVMAGGIHMTFDVRGVGEFPFSVDGVEATLRVLPMPTE